MTVILLTCSYDEREFVRVGYYVNNEYVDETLANEPPAKPVVEKVRRSILAEKPRVTRFNIKWDSEDSAPAEFPPEQPDVDAAEDDGAAYGAEEEEDEEDGEEEAEAPAEGEVAAVAKPEVKDGEVEMEGAEANGKEEDEESDVGSEDIGDESEDEEEEELEEEDGEAEGEVNGEAHDGDTKMEEGNAAPSAVPEALAAAQHQRPADARDVMVH